MPRATGPAKPPSVHSPRRGLSLGWRLSLSTSLIVTLIMGGITLVQQIREIQAERRAAVRVVGESLAPLVSDLELATTLAEVRRHLVEFHGAYVKGGNPDHQIQLRAEDGQVVYSTAPVHVMSDGRNLRAEVPVRSRALEGGRGWLTIAQSADEFEAAVALQWRDWWLHISITLVSILLFVQIVIRQLVTRPLERLLEGIRKMEMGYWGEIAAPGGAWEIRWLCWRFQNMGLELQQTVQRLVEAEKKAAIFHSDRIPRATSATALDRGGDAVAAVPESEQTFLELRKLCEQLEVSDPHDVRLQVLARDALENRVVEAERQGAMVLKARLEDAALRLLEPDTFLQLEAELKDLVQTRGRWRVECGDALRSGLEKERVPVLSLQHRSKHTAGVWKKMRAKGLSLEQVHDLFAFRVVVPTESDCYWALGVVHSSFKPVLGRFKDYIVAPKANGYQGLHTCVCSGERHVFEVQIRSSSMHRTAESGSASHLGYKMSSDDYEAMVSRLSGGWRAFWRKLWRETVGTAQRTKRP